MEKNLVVIDRNQIDEMVDNMLFLNNQILNRLGPREIDYSKPLDESKLGLVQQLQFYRSCIRREHEKNDRHREHVERYYSEVSKKSTELESRIKKLSNSLTILNNFEKEYKSKIEKSETKIDLRILLIESQIKDLVLKVEQKLVNVQKVQNKKLEEKIDKKIKNIDLRTLQNINENILRMKDQMRYLTKENHKRKEILIAISSILATTVMFFSIAYFLF